MITNSYKILFSFILYFFLARVIDASFLINSLSFSPGYAPFLICLRARLPMLILRSYVFGSRVDLLDLFYLVLNYRNIVRLRLSKRIPRSSSHVSLSFILFHFARYLFRTCFILWCLPIYLVIPRTSLLHRRSVLS